MGWFKRRTQAVYESIAKRPMCSDSFTYSPLCEDPMMMCVEDSLGKTPWEWELVHNHRLHSTFIVSKKCPAVAVGMASSDQSSLLIGNSYHSPTGYHDGKALAAAVSRWLVWHMKQVPEVS